MCVYVCVRFVCVCPAFFVFRFLVANVICSVAWVLLANSVSSKGSS